jgi:hypothetical protein
MDERSVPQLDDETANRLLEGGVGPDDAPPGYQEVAGALQAAAQVAAVAPAHEAGPAVAAFIDAIPARRTTVITKWKMGAAVLAGGLTLSTGLAAAGALPGPAQGAAAGVLSVLGISVTDGSPAPTDLTTVTPVAETTTTTATEDTTAPDVGADNVEQQGDHQGHNGAPEPAGAADAADEPDAANNESSTQHEDDHSATPADSGTSHGSTGTSSSDGGSGGSGGGDLQGNG